ncbi:Calx-beta domain-containing protein [Lyngbya aestuarii]|uniref:Calx-beta domain-containing protein n=1 Tax=Lyngbya aestuarii TaxID=118322 RepID=UPI00403DBA57
MAIRKEAEDMVLANYLVEKGNSATSGGKLISLYQAGSSTGTASFNFSGGNGNYDVVVGYFDENDGQAQLNVSMAGNQYNWSLNQNLGSAAVSSQNLVKLTIATGVNLTSGETITLSGTANQAEWARVDYIEFIPLADALPPVVNPGSIAFSSSTFSVQEDDTALQEVTLTRTGGTQGQVSVTLTPTNGTASTADYDSTPLVISFADGETQKTVAIPLVDDNLVEASETINLSLNNPTGGATLGSQQTAVLTIVDNDTATTPVPSNTPVRIEAENMSLTNYLVESATPASANKLITLFNSGQTQGSATAQFTGAAGSYNVVVGYFDENDGKSSLSAQIGSSQYNWVFDQNLGSAAVRSQNLVKRTIATGVTLTPGETITLSGTANQAEWARVDYIDFIPVEYTPPSSPSPTPSNNSDNTANYAKATSSVTVDLNQGTATYKFGALPDEKIKIMPLGDSNTRGKGSDPAGYRDNLWGLLKDDGFKIDFVGSQSTGFNSFDDNHEGHGGWKINDIAGSVNGWLNTYQPDFVLLMIGTNDTGSSNLSEMSSRLSKLIDQITNQSPDTHLLVGSILPNTQNQQRKQLTEDFNAKIPGIVSSKVSQGEKVSFVDIFDVLTPNDILSDGLHSTPKGYEKVANVWDKALRKTNVSKDIADNIKNIIGSDYDDVLVGDTGANVLDGGKGDDLMTGGAGNDIFVLAAENGIDIITDFKVGNDLLGLSGGLTFEQLTISQANNAEDTWIIKGSEQLALLAGVQQNAITSDIFTFV